MPKKYSTIGFICLYSLLQACLLAYAYQEPPDWERLANAIYKAEGGSKTVHPYGILVKYKTTTPKQACINTCKHKYRDWLATDQQLTYLEYLASKYAPIGDINDPTNLNKNWLRNVRYFYTISG